MKATMVKTTIFLGLLTLVPPAFAGHADGSFFVFADVVDVKPIVSRNTVPVPRTQCRAVVHHADRHGNRSQVAPAIIGGVIGGAIGNRFGDGDGRRALTVLGALTGASIAVNAAGNSHDDHPHRNCRTRTELKPVNRVDGYLVTYRYLGREFEKRVEQHPGERIRIQVAVDPVNPSSRV